MPMKHPIWLEKQCRLSMNYVVTWSSQQLIQSTLITLLSLLLDHPSPPALPTQTHTFSANRRSKYPNLFALHALYSTSLRLYLSLHPSCIQNIRSEQLTNTLPSPNWQLMTDLVFLSATSSTETKQNSFPPDETLIHVREQNSKGGKEYSVHREYIQIWIRMSPIYRLAPPTKLVPLEFRNEI